jgi:hypothetical protein
MHTLDFVIIRADSPRKKGAAMNVPRGLCTRVLVLAVVAVTVPAEGSGGRSDDGALLADAASYARAWSVSIDEAVRRLGLQGPAGALDAELAAAERGSFAGLWIDNGPVYRVVVAFADGGGIDRLAGRVGDPELASVLELRTAAYSLERLEAAQAAALHLVRQLGVPVESEIDVRANRVRIYVVDAVEVADKLAGAGLALPAEVVVDEVEAMGEPAANIYGGLALTTCSSGFSVKRTTSSTRGITTAAHCPNSQSYSGSALTFQAADQNTNQDVQWHTAPGFTVTNQFNSGIGVRNCTATKARADQAVGNYVCANGMTSGYRCGTISSKTYAPSYVTNASSTFIRVDDTEGDDLSEGGDSGGPWFLNYTAWGIHSGSPGADENDALYMAINYVSSLSISVLTAP